MYNSCLYATPPPWLINTDKKRKNVSRSSLDFPLYRLPPGNGCSLAGNAGIAADRVSLHGPVVHLHLQCRISWGGKEYHFQTYLYLCIPWKKKNTFTCDMSLQDNKICLLVFCWTNNSEIFHDKNRAFRYSYHKTRNQPIKTILRNCKIILQTRKVTEKKRLKC